MIRRETKLADFARAGQWVNSVTTPEFRNGRVTFSSQREGQKARVAKRASGRAFRRRSCALFCNVAWIASR